MKRLQAILTYILISFFLPTTVIGQLNNVEGIWKGTIPTRIGDIELYWRIDNVTLDSLTVLHDCPMYGVKEVPAPTSWISGDSVFLKVERFPATYYGLFSSNPDSITGFYQGEGGAIPMSLQRISSDPSLLLPFMAPLINPAGHRVTSWDYCMPVAHNDDWHTGDAEKAGLDIGLLDDLMGNTLLERYPNLHSILIARGDSLIFEEYFYDYHMNTPHPIYSNVKGIVSMGVGMALDEGLIPGISTPIEEFFPEYSTAFEGELQKDITLENLLTMTAGYEWNETSTSYYDPNNTNRQMMNSSDFVGFVLRQTLSHPPGEHFTYNSGLPVVLSEVVRRSVGEGFWEYMDRKLFGSLGFKKYLYETNKDGTAGGILLRPRDFLKIARLYINEGHWGKDQLIPEGWLNRSTMPEWNPERPPYWNHWGRSTIFVNGKPVTIYSGGGFGGQAIFGFPDLDLVVAFTAGNYSTPSVNYDDLLSQYILPPLVTENSGYLYPERSPKTELEGYAYKETFFTGIACLWSAMGQLNHEVSEAWVYGMTGTAFALNANEQMWPNCAGRWNNPKQSDHLGLLGFNYKTWSAYHLESSFRETRKHAWKVVRDAIDSGIPAWGFHMHLPENYIIYGYDEMGYYYKGVDCLSGFGPKGWGSVASQEPGWFEMHTLTPKASASIEDAVFAALQYAIEMHHSPEAFLQQGFVFGPEAYTQWQKTLSFGEADWMGIAYNAVAWSVARRNAAQFLGEVRNYVPSACDKTLQLAETEFGKVAGYWKEVSALFPYYGTERWERINNWQDVEKRERARELLLSASIAEKNGIKWIEKTLQLWCETDGSKE